MPPARSSILPRLVPWAFPALLALIATLYLRGNLGKNTDDYSINLRDPVTSALPSPFNPLAEFMYFWRPLHNAMRFTVGTLFPNADRAIHIFVALAHIATCLTLFLTLRRLTRTTLAPAIAAILFMVVPLHGEVVCWFNTTSTAIAAAICLASICIAARFARAAEPRPVLLLAIVALTFLVPCFYEQSAAIAAIIPFACFAVSAHHPLRTRLARAALATIAALIPCIAYILLLRATAPTNARGGSSTFIAAADAASRLHELLASARYNLIGERARDLLFGSITLGWRTVATPIGLVVGSTLFATAVLWLKWVYTSAAAPSSPSSSTEISNLKCEIPRLPLALSGVAIFIAAFLPVFIIDHQIVESRTLYIALIGAAATLAALLDLLLTSLPHRALRAAIAALAIAASIPGAIGLVGFQKLFQLRSNLDQLQLTHLQSLFSSPPPNTVFFPLQTNSVPVNTGYPLFDDSRRGVFETPWSASDAIKRHYRRNDIDASFAAGNRTPANSPPTNAGIHWDPTFNRNPAEVVAQPHTVPWDLAIPLITITDPNPIRLIRRIDIERPDHRDLIIRPPLITAAIEAHHPPTTTFLYIDGEPGPDLILIEFWRYADDSPVKLEPMWIWQAGPDRPSNAPPRPHRSTWLAAGAEGGARASMSVSMPPLNRPEYFLLRATIAPYDLDLARNPTPAVQELVVTMRSAPTKELATLRLDPKRFRREQRWVPLIVTIPPRPVPSGDHIVITIRRAADDQSPPGSPNLPIWVTPGYQASIPNDSPPKTDSP